jgi:pantothenate kinase
MKTPQHLAKAVLLMVTNNIGSIAMLHARAAGVRQIMFTGSFLHENQVIDIPTGTHFVRHPLLEPIVILQFIDFHSY